MQPFDMRRLIVDFKGKASVHQPGRARRGEERWNSCGVRVGVRTDDERLKDAGVYHEADRANHTEAQELIQGSTLGGAICK